MFDLNSISFWALVLSILTHAAASIWWASKLSSKVDRLERDVESLEDDQIRAWKTLNDINATMSRLDERTEMIVQTMLKLEQRLTK
jgi:hypothetical protein